MLSFLVSITHCQNQITNHFIFLQAKYSVHMSNQFRQKNQSFRKMLRKGQLDQYFKRAREQQISRQKMTEYISEKDEKMYEFNQKVTYHIRNETFQEIYFLCQQDDNHQLKLLFKNNCFDLFQAVCKNLKRYECIILLKWLIDVHYDKIFLNNQFKIYKQAHLFQSLFHLINKNVDQMSNQNDPNRQIDMKNVVVVYLECIFELICQSRKCGIQNSIQFQVFSLARIMNLWKGLTVLSQYPIFLIILYICELTTGFSHINEIVQLMTANPYILNNLLKQMIIQNGNNSLELASTLLVNLVLAKIQDKKQLIMNILPIFLKQIRIIYQINEQKSPNQHKKAKFRIERFEQMTYYLVFMLQAVSKLQLQNHLGNILLKGQFWQFMTLMLRVQTVRIRQNVFYWIFLAIENMVVIGVKLQQYIEETVFYFMVEAFDCGSQSIKQTNLNISMLLIDQSTKAPILLKNFYEYNLNEYLYQLQKSKNQKISQLASKVVELLQQTSGKIGYNSI